MDRTDETVNRAIDALQKVLADTRNSLLDRYSILRLRVALYTALDDLNLAFMETWDAELLPEIPNAVFRMRTIGAPHVHASFEVVDGPADGSILEALEEISVALKNSGLELSSSTIEYGIEEDLRAQLEDEL